MNKITTLDIELVLKRMLDPRRQLIVPNVSWGAGLHECDLLVISKAGYASEYEIKISMQDLKKDAKKKHNHQNPAIKALWFVMPELMISKFNAMDFVPAHAGVILIYQRSDGSLQAITTREAVETDANRWSDQEVAAIYRLGALRIWTLKEKVLKLRKQVEDLAMDARQTMAYLMKKPLPQFQNGTTGKQNMEGE